MTQWSVNPIFGSHLAVSLMAAVLVMLLLLIQPRHEQLTVRRRRLLIAIRGLLIALMTLAMFRPAIVSTSSTPQSAVLILLFDQSRSMQQPAAASDKSRWQAQLAALADVEDELAEFAKDFELRLYAYDEQLHPVRFQDGKLQMPEAPLGPQTDIGSSLHEAAMRELGRRVAGIILLGDGAQTAVNPRIGVQQAARELARLDYPLYTVAFGPVGDVARSRDVALESLPERFTVFVKNELVVQGTVRVRGYVNKDIPVELILEDESGATRTLGPRSITVQSDNQLVPLSMTFIPEEPGEFKLTMRAATQAGELATQNNELTSFLTVLEGGLRVLYLYGDLLGEQRFLRRSIDGAPGIQLDDLYVDPNGRQRWPIQLGQRLQPPSYDVLLIENVDVTALDATELTEIAERVERGTGLMMIGGYHSFGAGGYQNSPLSDVLPVSMGRFERQDLDPQRPVSRDLHHWEELTLEPVRPHPVTLLGTDASNRDVWRSLPPLWGGNKFAVKPSSQVLLASTSGAPMLVAGNYGRGRVLAFAGNTSGRWWQYGRQAAHRRFWRQAVLWLAHREDLNKNDVWIKLAQRRFTRGAPIEFTAGAQDAAGEPLPDAELQARLIAPSGTSSDVDVRFFAKEFHGGFPAPAEPGDYLIELTARRGEQLLGTTRASFQVIDRDLELSDPAADYAQLARLAESTRTAGGKPIAPEELTELLQEIRRQYRDVRVELEAKWQLGDTPLDAWLLFLGMLGLVTGEWVLRKRWGLV